MYNLKLLVCYYFGDSLFY